MITYYADIVDLFDVIEHVIIQLDGKTVTVRGKRDGKPLTHHSSYNRPSVADAVAQKLAAFAGIPKNS